MLVVYLFVQFGEVAFDFQQQSGYRVRVTLHVGKGLVVQLQHLVEVGQQSLSFENEGVRVDAHVVLLVLIILVVDLAHDFLQDILQRHNTTGATKLVHHNGNVHLVLLEFAQQVVNLLRLRHEIRRTNQRLPFEVVTLRQVGQQVLDIQNASDIVLRVLIDGNTRVVIVHHALQHLFVGRRRIQVNHILTTRHHLLHRFVAKAHNTLQYLLLLLDILGVRQLQRLLQLVHAQRLVLLHHHLLRQLS